MTWSSVNTGFVLSSGTQGLARLVPTSLFSLAGVSAVLSFTLIISFLRYPSLRKFPSELMFWRAVCDFLFAGQFISFQLANTDLDDNSPDAGKPAHVPCAFSRPRRV